VGHVTQLSKQLLGGQGSQLIVIHAEAPQLHTVYEGVGEGLETVVGEVELLERRESSQGDTVEGSGDEDKATEVWVAYDVNGAQAGVEHLQTYIHTIIHTYITSLSP